MHRATRGQCARGKHRAQFEPGAPARSYVARPRNAGFSAAVRGGLRVREFLLDMYCLCPAECVAECLDLTIASTTSCPGSRAR